MRNVFVLLAFAFACGTAQAQIKCWNDANGKRVCGDTPPPGARPTTIKGTTSGGLSAVPPAASKDGKKPLTAAEREQEARKKQQDAAKDAEKAAEEQKIANAKKENCTQARAMVRNLESGQRQVRIDEKGERVFLDDAQIAQDLAKAKALQAEWCN